ncbi:MAG: TlyA family rRNA (cytidine-2'-O)-methyltransferase [Acidobacteriaceae bacterium]
MLVQLGYVPSRERAQALILAGRVLVSEQKIEKAGAAVEQNAQVRLLGDDLKYVSRGGLKLEHALERWNIDLVGRTCLDVGTSTGGFVDCMLQRGAALVIAVDTGRGQIAEKFRSDERVHLLEKYNARYMKPEDIPAAVTFFCLDVSFISATLVLPAVVRAVSPSLREAVVLVKPQFEAGRAAIERGGIVRDEAPQLAAAARVREAVEALGAVETDVRDSPILGGKGNREFLLYAKWE